jgi:hypothetical protein
LEIANEESFELLVPFICERRTNESLLRSDLGRFTV